MQAFHHDVVIFPFRKRADEVGKPRPDLEAPHQAPPEKPLGPETCRSADPRAQSCSHLVACSAAAAVCAQASPTLYFLSVAGKSI